MSESELEVLELVVIEPSTILQAYTNGEGLDDAIDQVRGVVASFEHDMSTKESRKRTASLAYKVSKVKTKLDAMGKDLTDDWKKRSALVDSSRKAMREALDSLKLEARKPLDEWEAQQAAIEAKRIAIEEAEKLANQIESDHEIGLLMNDKIDRDKAEAEALRIREQQERDAKIAAEAAERATREAEEKASRKEAEQAAAILAAKEAEQRAKLEHEKALRQAEEQRVQAIKDAEEKAEREARAKEDARIAEEQRLIAEQEAREANREHCGRINREVLACMVKAGIEEVAAKHLIGLIARGLIDHISIKY